jgi:MFS family permease
MTSRPAGAQRSIPVTSERLPHKGRLLAVLLVGPFMAQADATIANVATPSIHDDLGASGAALELVIGGYMIAFAGLLITGARLGQTHGYRRVFVLGVSAFTAASVLCGVAPDPAWLVAARVLQGAGAALMFPQTLTGIQLSFEGAERARAVGLYAIALSSGAVAGQILGGTLISLDVAGADWRTIFLVNAPVGAAVVLAARRHLPADDDRGSARDVDVLGVATLSATIVLVVVPLVIGRAEGWPAWTWLSLAASVPALALFVVIERRIAAQGRAPLMNLGVIVRPAVSWSLLTLMLATGTYYALLFTLAQYLQHGLGRSPFVSGLTVVPWVAAFGIAGQVVRRLPIHLRPMAPTVGCALLAAAYVAISAALFADRRDEGLLVVGLAAGGLGLGLQFSSLIARVADAVPPRYAPDISGVSTTMITIGGSLGIAAFGTLYLSLPGDATHAFATVTAALAGAALLAAVAAYRSSSALAKW